MPDSALRLCATRLYYFCENPDYKMFAMR